MARVMMLGDTHGDTKSYLRAVNAANAFGVQTIFQLGDCGMFPDAYPMETQDHCDQVNELSRQYNIQNYWIRGNHDDPNMWENIVKAFPTRNEKGGYMRSNIILMPRVKYFKMFGMQFLEVGGAVSIDRNIRKEGYDWWPNEIITSEDMEKATLWKQRKVDVLLTHDCSDQTPFNFGIKVDIDSELNRRRVDDIIRKTQPDFHFHGHMHRKYEWENYMIHQGNHSTMTYGLECNKDGMPFGNEDDNFVIFDTETRKVFWKGEF